MGRRVPSPPPGLGAETRLALPRGCLDGLTALLADHGVLLGLDDQRCLGERLDLRFKGNLTTVQEQAVKALLAADLGVFVAPPGVGKTVVGAHLVAARGRSALVLVHRKPLLDQWVTQLALFLGLPSKPETSLAPGLLGGVSGPAMQKPTARDIMTPNVVVVRETMSIAELAGVLMSNMITGAPVVSGSGKLLGVVSATDIARHVALETSGVREERVSSYYVQGWEGQLDEDEFRAFNIVRDDGTMVRDIMTPVIFSVPETATLAELADTMIGGRIHRIIVTRDDDVVGVVSTLDLLKLMRSYLEET